MRWQGERQSGNVEDRRGMPVGRLAAGGGVGALLLVLVVTLLGGDPRALLQQFLQGFLFLVHGRTGLIHALGQFLEVFAGLFVLLLGPFQVL